MQSVLVDYLSSYKTWRNIGYIVAALMWTVEYLVQHSIVLSSIVAILVMALKDLIIGFIAVVTKNQECQKSVFYKIFIAAQKGFAEVKLIKSKQK